MVAKVENDKHVEKCLFDYRLWWRLYNEDYIMKIMMTWWWISLSKCFPLSDLLLYSINQFLIYIYIWKEDIYKIKSLDKWLEQIDRFK